MRLIFFFIILSSVSCVNNDTKIYSVLCDKFVKPFPPPYKKENNNISQKALDSLFQIPINVGFDKILFEKPKANIENKKIQNVSQKVETFSLQNLKHVKRNFNISVIKESTDRNLFFKENRAIIKFSQINYDPLLDEAFVLIGIDYGYLSSSLRWVKLKKEKNFWEIKDSKVLEKS